MNQIQPMTRRWLWPASLLGLLGPILSGVDGWRGTLSFALPKPADQLGMLVLVGALLLNRLPPSLRPGPVVFALLLIAPSTMLSAGRALS